MTRLFALIASGCGLIAAQAHGQVPSGEIRTAFNIQGGQVDPAPRQTRVNTLMLKQPLVPTGLVSLDHDVEIKDYALQLPAGTQLFKVDTDTGSAFCTSDFRFSLADSLAKGVTRSSQVCFADTDKSGHFNVAFTAKKFSEDFLILFGAVPRTLQPITPTIYHAIDPSLSGIKRFVGIRYAGKRINPGRPEFALACGVDDEILFEPGRGFTLTKGDYPTSITILGSLIVVTAAEKGSISYHVDQPIPPQPFNLGVTKLGYR